LVRLVRSRARSSWALAPVWYRAVAVLVAALIAAASVSYAAGHLVQHAHVELGGWLVLLSLPLALVGTVLWLCAMVLRDGGSANAAAVVSDRSAR
jgi:hypothetical protein